MTNLNHEYPEYTNEDNTEDSVVKAVALEHYNYLCFEAMTDNIDNMPDQELVDITLKYGGRNKIAYELAKRFNEVLKARGL